MQSIAYGNYRARTILTEASISQEKEFITNYNTDLYHKVFFKIYLLVLFLAKVLVRK